MPIRRTGPRSFELTGSTPTDIRPHGVNSQHVLSPKAAEFKEIISQKIADLKAGSSLVSDVVEVISVDTGD